MFGSDFAEGSTKNDLLGPALLLLDIATHLQQPIKHLGAFGAADCQLGIGLFVSLFQAMELVRFQASAVTEPLYIVNPFVAVKSPNQTTERGFARRLPVELTMANDLPIMLECARAHAWFSDRSNTPSLTR